MKKIILTILTLYTASLYPLFSMSTLAFSSAFATLTFWKLTHSFKNTQMLSLFTGLSSFLPDKDNFIFLTKKYSEEKFNYLNTELNEFREIQEKHTQKISAIGVIGETLNTRSSELEIAQKNSEMHHQQLNASFEEIAQIHSTLYTNMKKEHETLKSSFNSFKSTITEENAKLNEKLNNTEQRSTSLMENIATLNKQLSLYQEKATHDAKKLSHIEKILCKNKKNTYRPHVNPNRTLYTMQKSYKQSTHIMQNNKGELNNEGDNLD